MPLSSHLSWPKTVDTSWTPCCTIRSCIQVLPFLFLMNKSTVYSVRLFTQYLLNCSVFLFMLTIWSVKSFPVFRKHLRVGALAVSGCFDGETEELGPGLLHWKCFPAYSEEKLRSTSEPIFLQNKGTKHKHGSIVIPFSAKHKLNAIYK